MLLSEKELDDLAQKMNDILNEYDLIYKPKAFSDMIEEYKRLMFFNITRDHDHINYMLDKIAEKVFKLQGIEYKRNIQ